MSPRCRHPFDLIGVAVANLDLVDGNAREFARELGEGRVVALAVGRRAGEEQGGAIGLNLTAAELRRTQWVGDLHIGGPADPQQWPCRVVDPGGLLRPKASTSTISSTLSSAAS